MASHAVRARADSAPAAGLFHAPAEGWSIVLLHCLMLLIAGWAIHRADWAAGTAVLIPVAFFGWLVGFIQAKARVPDFLAHMLALLMGIAISALATTAIMEGASAGLRQRIELLWHQFATWTQEVVKGKPGNDIDLFVLVMAITLWLVAYCSAWMLFRRRWLGVSILLPAIIILINAGYAPHMGTGPVIFYLLAAGILAARHYAFRRQQEWRSAQIPMPRRLTGRFFQAGVTITLVVMVLGWALPATAPFDPARDLWNHYGDQVNSAQNRLNDWFAKLSHQGPGESNTYPEFGESFQLGGPLNLGNQAVMILHGSESQYLIGHTYDRYDGHGWKSDVNHTFDPQGDGGQSAPEVTFEQNQGVHLSADVTGARAPVTNSVTLIQPTQDLLFTTDTYSESNQATSVQLSWRQLNNEPYDVQHVDLSTVPPDLASFIQLLRSAQFKPGSDGTPANAIDPDVGRQISAAQEDLTHRFLNTDWDIDDSGRVTVLHVTGKVPVYDDIEAVFDQGSLASQSTYTVTGLTSTATPEMLAQAGTTYPDFVIDRYLQLPTTVTQRTRDLAKEVTAGDTNPFDEAMAIQNFVRNRITYDENVSFPPNNQDVVDYVLFDSKKGYCEYYASSMIVMLRSLGVPARMVVGFYPAPYDASVGGYVYRQRYAHAWVEVYFPGYGWIPFEPTAARPPLDYGTNGAQPESRPTPTVTIGPSPAAETTAAPTPTPVPPVTQPNNGGGQQQGLGSNHETLGWVSGIAVMMLGLLAVVAIVAWLWGLRGLSLAGGLYARLLRVGRLVGVERQPAMTPGEYADAIGNAVPQARDAARYVADLYAVEQYGGHPVNGNAVNAGQRAWRHVRRLTVLAGLSVRRRWRRREGAGE